MAKLTPAQETVVDDLRGGSIIYSYHEDGAMKFRTLRGTCERLQVRKKTLDILVSRGVVSPCGDGLFGTTQTYRLAEASHGA
ncbi:hypothetical protein [Thalassospira marina]|uniref:Uncharacterized protein n=1 Tax=Thalassospira marina TaxID=2048283 RepID=A0A2N3KY06_9PROT|nr:hypothetical protein [Thalassospira marina]PKR55428.1 hypothetical protein COO20_04455 [Thalassospira marina]